MLFKEFWVIAVSGAGMAASPAFVLGDKLLLIETRSSNSNRGRWITVDGKDDYSGKGYGDSWIKLTVQKKSDNQKYQLTRFYKDMDFSLPFTVDETQLEKISKSEIDIQLFKQSIWSDVNLTEDKFESIGQDKVNDLFNNKDEKKIKKLLLSLSSRRYWKRTGEWDFYSLFDFYRPENIEQLTYNIKIKYFSDFDTFKKYVHDQIEKCPENGKCEATTEGLKIIDQDTLEFFKEPE